MPNTDVGIPYFPLRTSLDEKFELLEAEFGVQGFAVVIKLYQRIYSRGYYCDWTPEVELLFARACGLGCCPVSEIIKCATRRGIFDADLLDKYNVLTSKGIQMRYFEAVRRRKTVEAVREYLLLPHNLLPPNVSISSLNVNISGVNVDRKQQRRVKESKGEESRVKEYAQSADKSASAPAYRLILHDGSYYPISKEDISKWGALYPAVDIEQEIRKMIGWSEANPQNRKTKRGALAFINRWLAREQDKGGARHGELSRNDTGFNPYEKYGGTLV